MITDASVWPGYDHFESLGEYSWPQVVPCIVQVGIVEHDVVPFNKSWNTILYVYCYILMNWMSKTVQYLITIGKSFRSNVMFKQQ